MLVLTEKRNYVKSSQKALQAGNSFAQNNYQVAAAQIKDPEARTEANAKDQSFGSIPRIMYTGSNCYCVCISF